MTCGACGYRWESHARSQKSRCGRCRTIVYVPASVRHANEAGAPSRAPRSPERGPARSRPTHREASALARVRLDLECCDLAVSVDRASARTGAMLRCPGCGQEHEVVIVTGQPVAVPAVDDEPQPSDDGWESGRSSTPRSRQPPFTSPSRRPTGHAGGVTRPPPDPALPGSWAVRGGLGRWSCGHEGTIPTTADDARPEREPCPTCGCPGLLSQRTPEGWAPVTARR